MALFITYFGLLVKYLPLNSVSKETKSYFTSDSESRNIEVENSEKKKSFECPRCSKCFGTKQILKNHLNRKKRCLQLKISIGRNVWCGGAGVGCVRPRV